MKTFLFFACFLLNLACVFAQKPEISWGPELYKNRKTDISHLIGADAASFYCIRQDYSLFGAMPLMLEKYSSTKLNLEYIKPFIIPEVNEKKLKFEKAVLLNGLLMVFASRYDRELDKHILCLMRVNAADGARLDTPQEIDFIAADKKSNRGSFDFVLSRDSSKLLIMHNEPYERYEKQKFSFKLIDAEGKTLWSAAFDLPYRDKYFTLGNYRVDNNGDVYMLASITKEKSERERRRPTYTYDLINYKAESKELKEMPINLNEKFISDISFAIEPGGNIIIGGFYSNKNKDGLAGTFYLTVDKTNLTELNRNTQDFSTAFLSEFMSERRAEKHKELYDYKIDYLVTKPDGGLYLVAEQYFLNVVTVCQPRGGCTTTYYYYYNDIIVVKFNANASLQWIKRIPKSQVSTNDDGYLSSYAFNASENKLYFLYNDNPKNYTKPKKYPRNGICRKMVTVAATLDSEGNLNRDILFSTKEQNMSTRPKIALRLSSRQSVYYATKRKKYKFGLVTYP